MITPPKVTREQDKALVNPESTDSNEINRSKSLLRTLGPGLITGAADDDPSGIATYSQVGSQFGYAALWTLPFSYPLMGCIQQISAEIGRVTGRGIAGNLRRHYHPVLLYVIVASMVVANVINIGADIGAMGSAASLLIGGPWLVYATLFATVSVLLQVFLPYERYSKILKWLCLALFSYVITVFLPKVHVPWGYALYRTFVPHFAWNSAFITGIVAVLGTTISPYLFFWQASEEVENEEVTPEEQPLLRAPSQAVTQLHRIRVDTWSGMAFSNIVAFFIMLTGAVVLNAHGVTNIQTSEQAASALTPLAGNAAHLFFAFGIIGTGLLAIPVLAGSAAYGVGEAFKWPVGMHYEPKKAKGFYWVLGIATIIGLALDWLHINPIKALFWSAVINGVVAGPIMIMMMFMASNTKIMGAFRIGIGRKVFGWLATAVMLAAAVGLFATWGQ